jgi:hypothetical protein
MRSSVWLSAFWPTVAQALSAAAWESQLIYQIVTDRFARTDGSTTASCTLSQYCGGTWQGIINHLDYIQGMGFTAVSPKVNVHVGYDEVLMHSIDLDLTYCDQHS